MSPCYFLQLFVNLQLSQNKNFKKVKHQKVKHRIRHMVDMKADINNHFLEYWIEYWILEWWIPCLKKRNVVLISSKKPFWFPQLEPFVFLLCSFSNSVSVAPTRDIWVSEFFIYVFVSIDYKFLEGKEYIIFAYLSIHVFICILYLLKSLSTGFFQCCTFRKSVKTW